MAAALKSHEYLGEPYRQAAMGSYWRGARGSGGGKKPRGAYFACSQCEGSWVYTSRAGQPGWEKCKKCGTPWTKIDGGKSVSRIAAGGAVQCGAGQSDGAAAAEVLRAMWSEANAAGNEERVAALVRVCLDVAKIEEQL